MSFILQALKKAEKTRQQSSIPGLNTQHDEPKKPTRKLPQWLWQLLALVLLNGLILLWIFGPWSQDDQQVTTETTPALIPELKAQAAVTAQTPTPPVPIKAESAPLATIVAPAAISVAQPVSTANTPTQIETTSNLGEYSAPLSPPPQTEIPTISELPPHLQQQLPPLHMSVHAFTGNNNSLIRLDNKLMRQGSSLDENLLLEQITADGAILNYQGYRFKIERKGN
jgi:general secretion pathway protein B